MKYIKYTGKDSYYFALIAAVSIPAAHATYEAEICEFNTDDGIADFIELTKEEFVDIVAETISEETGKAIGKDEAVEQLNDFDNDFAMTKIARVFGIDGSLI
ncbi:hypothetical protein [Enterococcus larvae]|uniref:hypothetical protein n=1 Tax=Enterococcus larvae TaxID=2794352 RepID=UPI003F41734A